MRSGERREHQRVLDPMARTQGSEPVARAAAGAGQKTCVAAQRPQLPRQAGRQVDADGAPCAFPNGKVTPLVSDVVEFSFPEPLDQRRRLDRTDQIGSSVGSEITLGSDHCRKRRDNPRV